MISRDELVQQLEDKRVALNRELMLAKSQAEANRIERELWALRTADAHHKAAKNKPESLPADLMHGS